MRTQKFIYKHRVGEIYRVFGGARRHRWVYYPDMELGECLLFKAIDAGRLQLPSGEALARRGL